MRMLLLSLGGAAGTVLRYLVSVSSLRLLGQSNPWGTLAVNMAGCFILLVIMEWSARSTGLREDLRLMLGTGFCGGLTTYSTMNLEVLSLWREGQPAMAAAYLTATVVACGAAGILGILVGRSLFG